MEPTNSNASIAVARIARALTYLVDAFAIVTLAACSSRTRRANTCCVVMARCGCPRPRNAIAQLNRTVARFWKPREGEQVCTAS
jgi:hypothetical protein